MAVHDKPLGASGSTVNDLGNMGALTPILGRLAGGSKGGQMAIDFAQQMYPDPPKADPYEAALQFFLAMGQGASQPGATVLGSAVGAMQAPADYLAAKKKEKRETDQARMQTALQLAPSLKPGAGKVTYRPATKEELAQYGATAGQMSSSGQFVDLSRNTGTGSTSTVSVDPANLETLRTFLSLPNLTPDENNNVVLSNANVVKASNQGLVGPKKSTASTEASALTNYKFTSPEALAKFKEKYPDIILTPDQEAGTQPLGLPNAISNDPDLLGVFSKFSEPKSGTLYERLFSSVNDIGTRLADESLAPLVTQAEKNEYAANYQKLIVGGEFTEIIDGKEVTKRRPGIDLSETTNLPVPEGLDLDAIIEERRQSFDQGQNTNATFGSRMLFNEGILRNMLAEGYVVTLADIAQINARETLGLGNIGADPQAIQFHIAAQNWSAANLRNESGAAIAPSEYAGSLEQYFPKVGDDAKTIKQKQTLRESVTRGMINSSAGAFDVVYPNGVKYLSYTAPDGTLYEDILNAQGYANELLAKTELGQNLFFKEALASKPKADLIRMLQNPNAENLYTPQMIDMIAEELRSRENQ
ncbi:hypothetical protein CRP902_gp33 [Roseobacter phage CRP-902]|nr:hypothetical protein CRP902_gp33 [Roseobacter phage CRP-902]